MTKMTMLQSVYHILKIFYSKNESRSLWPELFWPISGVGRFGLGRWVVSANFLRESIRPSVVSAQVHVYGNSSDK